MDNNLFEYGKKLGINHNINKKGNITEDTNELKQNFKYIKNVYEQLYKHNELGISIHPAGEWILDNLYIIEKEVLSLTEDLYKNKKYDLPKINNRLRINILAEELVRYTDGKINASNIKTFLTGYSNTKYLSLQELWIFPLCLKIELIKYIKKICEDIIYVQNQRYKVESIIERLIEGKERNEQKFNINIKNNEISEINIPFIEYMAYKLNNLDKEDSEYIDAFDEQVLKLGTTVDEIVSRAHLEIVTKQTTIGNAIISLKDINNINFSKELENISEIDIILSQEKMQMYSKMDSDTLDMYRKKVYTLSKNIGVSQKYICRKIIELCEKNEGKKSHSGYYLLNEAGESELINGIKSIEYNQSNEKKISKNTTLGIYLACIWGITFFVTIAISVCISIKFKYDLIKQISSILLSILITVIPISQLIVYFIDKLILRFTKPNILPALDYEKIVPKENATFVIIPTLLNSTKRVKELIRSIEMYYLLNKQDNIYFALLGDTSEIDEKHIKLDDEIIKIGNEEVKKLNKKYKFETPKFYFIYRDRVFNEKQRKYLGWERKRGLITQFNRYLIYGERSDFNNIYIDREKIGKIKYVLTIDADTQIGINSISKLIGIMAHPLNTPILNKEKTAVISGHALLQPRISTSIECADRNIFSKIYAGYGGIDTYTNAISDIYQDMWDEGIFTGKGIYDLKIFSDVLDNQIPENTVLSHDLLEGSFLRCGLVTNVEFIDGFPSRYINYIVRQNRWFRGDLQIARWIGEKIPETNENTFKKKRKNPLNILSRWKILDNLRRGFLDISVFAYIVLGLSVLNIKWYLVLLFTFSIYLLPALMEKILNLKNIKLEKSYIPMVKNFEAAIYRTILDIVFLPYKAITNIETAIKTIYRMKISKKNLLEWLTAEQAERLLGKDLKTYINEMYISGILGVINILLSFKFSIYLENSICAYILGLIWTLSPIIAWYISKNKKQIELITQKDTEFLRKVALDTWKYFNDYLTKETNYLIPDNFQEERDNEVVYRTSSTNIGLSLMAIVCAYDMNFISKEKVYELVSNILDTIDKLEKYKGNLFNWYNIQSLEKLNDGISSVDNGNYIAYLYVLKSFFENEFKDEKITDRISKMINELDFSILYDSNKQLFSIEYRTNSEEKSKSYYDLLASETRTLSYVAIAKGDVPYKHWYKLSRNLTEKKGYKGLVSWTGTSFEYFMPYGLMKSYKYSLFDETYKCVAVNQREYVKKFNIPWGISESAFYLHDMEYNYQYKAFGIPGLGLKRGLKDDLVISPYASIMILPKYPNIVLKNMKDLIDIGAYGKYGFYDSIDYTKERIEKDKYKVVKTFMAHHQGLILIAINNAINKNIIQKRFSRNVEIEALDILLQEKISNNIVLRNKTNNVIYQEKKEESKCVEIYQNNVDKSFENIEYNILSNKDYTFCINSNGDNFEKINDIYINRYRNYENENGLIVLLKNRIDNTIDNIMLDSNVTYTAYNSKFEKQIDNLNIETNITVLGQEKGHIRNIKIKNNGEKEIDYELFFYQEPILTNINNDISHMAYSNMFLEYDKYENGLIVHRRKKHAQDKDIYLTTQIVCDKDVGNIDFEIDKYKFIGRNKNIYNANMIKKGVPLSNNLLTTINPIIAYKVNIKLKPDESINIAYVSSLEESIDLAKSAINKYSSYENIKNNIGLAFSKALIETKFYNYCPNEIMAYQQIIKYIIENNTPKIISEINLNIDLKQSNLWQVGISGDNPIITIEINRKIETPILKEILNAFKYICNKGIKFDLCILINSQKEYVNEIRNKTNEYIISLMLGYYINNGIYILEKDYLNESILKLLDILPVIKFNSKNGTISSQLKKLRNKQNTKQIINTEEKVSMIVEDRINQGKMLGIDIDSLNYYNEIGGFDNNNDYNIILKDGYMTPAPWSNVIANKNVGTIINENGGGYTYFINSSQNKINRWKNDQVIDDNTEYILIKEGNKIWSTTCMPINVQSAEYYIKHARGYSTFESNINDIYIKETVFVPLEDNKKIIMLDILNTREEKRKIDLIYNMNIQLGNEVQNKIYNIYSEDGKIYCRNVYNNEYDETVCFSISNEDVDNYVDKTALRVDNVKNPYIEMTLSVELDCNKNRTVVLCIEFENNPQDTEKNVEKSFDKNFAEKEKQKVVEKWKNVNNVIRVNTPIESMNILLNDWLIYQTISSRLNARSGYYQSSGAFGFRDQLQDTLSIMYVCPEMARERIIKHASHQFLEGDVQHWWHQEKGNGIRSRYSDDLLWLVYATLEYIKITGDNSILEEKVLYLESKVLAENEKERYEIPEKSNISESIYNHLIRAINKSIDLSEKDLPLINGGDWSDGLNNVYGESVWLGFFLYDILKKFIRLPNIEEEKAERYKQVIIRLERGLEKSWDGKWFKRAYYLDGKTIGSNENIECKIDSLPQAWSVISDFPNLEKKKIAMESVDNLLVDRENMIIKLFTPPFNKTLDEPGYIKGYLAGIRENGGQYTHGAIWNIIANCILENGNLAEEYFRMINPIEHARTNHDSRKYKVEPYVVAADIYSANGVEGRGGWTWYTGAASWLYKAGIEYILGFKKEGDILKIEPCINSNWKQYEIQYKYIDTHYYIKVENENNKQSGVSELYLDNIKINEKYIKLINDKQTHNIRVVM